MASVDSVVTIKGTRGGGDSSGVAGGLLYDRGVGRKSRSSEKEIGRVKQMAKYRKGDICAGSEPIAATGTLTTGQEATDTNAWTII